MGHRATAWCPRCGTSLSQHELTQSGVYQERSDPSLYVRFPLLDRPGESLVVWTTTPVDAARERRRRRASRRRVRPARERRVGARVALPGRHVRQARARARSSSAALRGPVRHARARSAPSSTASSRGTRSPFDEGTGIVHIATGCGPEDFELGQALDLPVIPPVDESGHFYDDFGWLHGLSTLEAADQIVGDLGERGFLVEAGTHLHNYAHCWRCDTPIIYRLSDDWFISVEEIRPKLLEENAKVEWVPEYMGKRMDDWLRNMGDWNISRRRYYGLPLPFYPCACGHLNVIGSKAELEERAIEGFDQLEELRRPVDRPRADPLRGVRRDASTASPRSATSGSTPASSRSRRSAGRTPSGSTRATRPAPPRA